MLKPEMLKFGKAKRANRNAVQVRQREERSDETSTKLPAIAADYWMPDPRANMEQPEVWPGMRAFERGGV